MKNLIVILFLFSLLRGQNNLVLNPSFEDSIQCPISLGCFSSSYLFNWENPSWNSPDYFHTCNNGIGWSYNVSTPSNFTGFQNARTGQGYAGATLIYASPNGREYIEGKLVLPLVAEKKYCGTFYVSLADSCIYASNRFGIHFRNTLYQNLSILSVLPLTPQIDYNGSVISDSINWVKISGEFTALGGEQYMIIGSFATDVQTDADTNLTPPKMNYAAYYYIDDVSVYESAEAFAGKDTIVCAVTDSIQLGKAGRADLFYSWSPTTGLNNPNIANPLASPLVETTYTLTVTDTNSLACNSLYTDTVTIYRSCVGISENQHPKTTCTTFPNPFSNSLTFSLSKSSDYTLLIYDISGKQLQKKTFSGSKYELENFNAESGIYHYCIEDAKGEKLRGKLLKL